MSSIEVQAAMPIVIRAAPIVGVVSVGTPAKSFEVVFDTVSVDVDRSDV